MILVTLESFTGEFQLAKSFANDPVLQSYIDNFEAKLIRQLLGVELGNLLIAYIQSSSSVLQPRFDIIIEPFQYQPYSKIWESEGLEKMLAEMIFCEYVFGTQVKQTQSGATLNISETSNTLSASNAARTGEKIWNQGVLTANAIQWYVRDFKREDYPEYKFTKHFPVRFSSML